LAWAKQGSHQCWPVPGPQRYRSRGGWYEREAQKRSRANWSRIDRYTGQLCRIDHLPGSYFN
jgi:hypothetical protein